MNTPHAQEEPGEPSVYDPRGNQSNFIHQPWAVYFHYVYGTLEHPQARFYSYSKTNEPIDPSKLRDIAEHMAANALRSDAEQFPPCDGTDWKTLEWKRKSYMIFVVDIPGTRLQPGNGLTVEGIPNHSFFDAVDFPALTIRQPDGGSHQADAICLRNHMKRDAAGSELGNRKERIDFSLNTNPPFPMAEYPDSGGNNTGPGIPP